PAATAVPIETITRVTKAWTLKRMMRTRMTAIAAAAMSRSGGAPRVWGQASIVKLHRSTWGELLLTFPTLTTQVPGRNAGPRRRAPARGAAYRPENCVKPLRRSDYRH